MDLEQKLEALELLDEARKATDRGDDEAAMELVSKSLKLFETEEAKNMAEFFTKFGPRSPAAAAIARVLTPKLSHYEVMRLKAGASGKEIKRSYKQLSLELHPDRNHARGAEDAFKRLSAAFCVLSSKQARAAYDADLRGGGRPHGPGGYAAGGARGGSATDRSAYTSSHQGRSPPPSQQQQQSYRRAADPPPPKYGDEPKRDMSAEALMRENATLRSEMHRRRAAETQASMEAAVKQREARAAVEEVQGLRRRLAESDRTRRAEISEAVGGLASKLAASESEVTTLRRELHAKKLELDESRAESEAVTAAVNALINRLEGTPVGLQPVHADAGKSGGGGGVGVTVVGSKVGARELVMRLAATLSGSPRKARTPPVAVMPASRHTSKTPPPAHANPRTFKTMAQLREEVRERRRAEAERPKATSQATPPPQATGGSSIWPDHLWA